MKHSGVAAAGATRVRRVPDGRGEARCLGASSTDPPRERRGGGVGARVGDRDVVGENGGTPRATTDFEEQTIEARVEIEPDGRSAGSLSWVGTDDNRSQLVPVLTWSFD